MNQEQNSIEYTVGKDRYIFTWPSGRESELAKALDTLVHNPDLDFSWYNAACVLHQSQQRQSCPVGRFSRFSRS